MGVVSRQVVGRVINLRVNNQLLRNPMGIHKKGE